MARVLFFDDVQGPSSAQEVAFPTVTEGLMMAAYTRQEQTHSLEYRNNSRYWITLSAVAISGAGISRPRTFAVLRLMAISNLIGC